MLRVEGFSEKASWRISSGEGWLEKASRRRPTGEGLPVDRISSAVYRGVSHDGRFVGGGARNQEPDGDTRHKDIDLDMFGSSDRRNTIRPVSLVYCIEMY